MDFDLKLKRRPSSGDATIGELFGPDGELLCHTLEDVVREVEGEPVDLWKVHGATAIPRGRYRVVFVDSPRFGPGTLSLVGVEGFKYILMHAGNLSKDTEGCILLGLRVSDNAIVGGTSRPAVEMVKAVVRAAINAGNTVWLEVA